MSSYDGVPGGWLDYTKVGTKIEGTNFIAFKVPLNDQLNNLVKPANQQFNVAELLEKVPKLDLIIDLTYTDRYYKPEFFQTKGIKYVKIMVPGQQIPMEKFIKQFSDEVKMCLNQNSKSKKLIGVHCTHGVNRTGFFICHFMISEMHIAPREALKRFENARGHKIIRENYVDYLMNLKNITHQKNTDFKFDANRVDVDKSNRGIFGQSPEMRVENDTSLRFNLIPITEQQKYFDRPNSKTLFHNNNKRKYEQNPNIVEQSCEKKKERKT